MIILAKELCIMHEGLLETILALYRSAGWGGGGDLRGAVFFIRDMGTEQHDHLREQQSIILA